MESIFRFINQGWVGSFIGLVGVIIAIVTFKKSKIGPRLVFQWDSFKIIDKNHKAPQEIEISYNQLNVERVIKTTIVIWNSGNNTVYGSSIAKEDPWRFEFNKDETVISVRLIKTTKSANNFTIERDQKEYNTVICSFNYLDPNDGAVIELLHTDNERYPQVKGTFIGMPQGILNWSKQKRKNVKTGLKLKKHQIKFTFYSVTLLIGIITLLFAFVTFTGFDARINEFLTGKTPFFVKLIYLITGIFYIIYPSYSMWTTRRKFPKTLVYED